MGRPRRDLPRREAARSTADQWLLFAGLVIWHVCNYRFGGMLRQRMVRIPDPLFYVGYGAACLILLYFVPANAEPFIYFQF